MAINDMSMWRSLLLLLALSAILWHGCEKKHCDVEVSPQARQASAHIGDMAKSMASGQVSCKLNSMIAEGIASVSNQNERKMLLEQYKDAVSKFAVSQLDPDHEMLRKAWKFKDFFCMAHQTVCNISSNDLEGVYFALRIVTRLEAEAGALDARLKTTKDEVRTMATYTGPDLSERGCLVACARSLRDDAKSIVQQYVDMPRHLFDEYTNGCSEKEKKKIVEEIRMAIGRDPKFF